MEFLVRMTIIAPGDSAEVAVLRAAEAERAAELARSGTLLRLWRIPGDRANWGLWQAYDATALHEALTSLPLWPHARFEVHALAAHPNDPG